MSNWESWRRRKAASSACPDSRGRLSPHGLLLRPNAHDQACADLPDLSAYLQRDGLAQIDPGDRICLDLAVYFHSSLLQLSSSITDRFGQIDASKQLVEAHTALS